MRKLLLVNMAVATLAAGALTSDRAEAAPLAGARTATNGASPIEQVACRRPGCHRRYHYGYYYGNRYRYGYKPYSPPSRVNRPGGFYYR